MTDKIDKVNLTKRIDFLEKELKYYKKREVVHLDNGFILLNTKKPTDDDQKIFDSLAKYAESTVTKKKLQPKRTGAYNKPSGQLEDNWDKMLEIYQQKPDLSLQKIADAMFERHNIVISTYFVKRFRTIVRAKQQGAAAETKPEVD